MASQTAIEWTDCTWNPASGCTKISAGCAHCYAERMARRLEAMGQARYRNGFAVTLHPEALEEPLGWKKSRLVFVNSMGDLFHEEIPLEFIQKVFDVMNRCPQHIFQILTKRSQRMAELAPLLEWGENIWMGVTVENSDYLHRIECLQRVPARVCFLSLEPLLGPLDDLVLDGLDWVIVGGESGPQARPMKEEWVLSIQSKCQKEGVPFFFKQWGGVNKKKAGRLLQDRTWDQLPAGAYVGC
ncbi:MAG TPA: phage Gp37/Gp68 family protein [Anaerohalosphaeraceae bacterium]|jgi:protein gp37|nr:phage Gp37/Gp68 family protein [Anaerohalosphaeraceae bacterium]HPB93266.1 phage Gp37/Gp68 family protein [Anaerohalosphaeraceae bacterium]HRT23720.1 phage Gp37/Gp68 family protein [Anaerohalosphaeraceae bacterium]HRU15363.1 phage Gp37/Gp68 family protein [Anaerohalosphaeraceae bacterium]